MIYKKFFKNKFSRLKEILIKNFPQVEVWYRKYIFLKDVLRSRKVIAEMQILNKKFFFEPLRTSFDEISGLSGLKKIYNNDSYGLKLLKNKNPTILDIGAHIGIFPRVIKNHFPNANIHSLEPDRDNFLILSLNNKIIENTFTYQYAISSKNSNLKLRASNKNSWRSTLNINKNFFRSELIGDDLFNYDEYLVECYSIDNFIDMISIDTIDMIGITVPGEIALLIIEGAKKTLRNLNPIISISLYPNEVIPFKEKLEELNYKLVKEPVGSMYTFAKL